MTGAAASMKWKEAAPAASASSKSSLAQSGAGHAWFTVTPSAST